MKKSLVRTGAVRTGATNLNKLSIFKKYLKKVFEITNFKDILSALEPYLDILRHFEPFLDESLPLVMSAKKSSRCALVPQSFLSGAGAVREQNKFSWCRAHRKFRTLLRMF